MSGSKVFVHREFVISEVDPRIYGSFTEHMGRCIYEGIYEPNSTFADEDGLRKDVMELVKELGVTIVRYPGGNFLSGYDWKDGIGPLSERETRLDLAWHSLESNQFGTDQFLTWCEKVGVEPMMAVNLGTAGLPEALEILEYTNVDANSKWANLRKKNGQEKPYGVKVWCLGNEMDGPWQLGHKNAEDYGTIAAEVARGMRQIDDSLELVIAGSSNRSMPTFGSWEQSILEKAYDLVDHVSLHTYYEDLGNTQEFLLCSTNLDYFINEVCDIADAVKAKLRSNKTITLSLDEWNVWRLSKYQNLPRATTWDLAPRVIEDEYDVADAVVLGNLLISILRRSDRVKIACLAQLVNVIAPIRAEVGHPAWRQTTFFPFSYTARYGRGKVLATGIDSSKIKSETYGDVSTVDSVMTYDESTKTGAIFLVNRSLTSAETTEIQLSGFKDIDILEQATVTDQNLKKTNTLQNGEQVTPDKKITAVSSGNSISVQLPPASWQMVRVTLNKA